MLELLGAYSVDRTHRIEVVFEIVLVYQALGDHSAGQIHRTWIDTDGTRALVFELPRMGFPGNLLFVLVFEPFDNARCLSNIPIPLFIPLGYTDAEYLEFRQPILEPCCLIIE